MDSLLSEPLGKPVMGMLIINKHKTNVSIETCNWYHEAGGQEIILGSWILPVSYFIYCLALHRKKKKITNPFYEWNK